MEPENIKLPLNIFQGCVGLTCHYLTPLNVIYLQGHGGRDDKLVVLLSPDLKEFLFVRTVGDGFVKKDERAMSDLLKYHGVTGVYFY